MIVKLTASLPVMILWSVTAIAATPIGTLQSDGRLQIIAAETEAKVNLHQPEYTFFSGDTVVAGRNDAVLNLNGGGGLGFPKGSRVQVVQTETGDFEIELIQGALLYAFPEGRENFLFRVGNFEVFGRAPEVRSMQVASDGASVGTIERLADGNLKTTVRSGALYVRNGDSVRYTVSAGESVGLLDTSGQTIRTQSEVMATSPQPLVLIQSPERVGTSENFIIRWTALEPVDGDYVVIAESGAEPDEFESLVSSDEGNELEFEAPGTPGDYEIRFIDGQTGAIKRFVFLDVVQDLVPFAWWDQRVFGAVLGVTAGATAVYIVSEQDGGGGRERPVSP